MTTEGTTTPSGAPTTIDPVLVEVSRIVAARLGMSDLDLVDDPRLVGRSISEKWTALVVPMTAAEYGTLSGAARLTAHTVADLLGVDVVPDDSTDEPGTEPTDEPVEITREEVHEDVPAGGLAVDGDSES